MTPEQILAWAAEFEQKHGYTPNKDMQVVGQARARGATDEEAQMSSLQHHMEALKFGQDFQAMNGRPPTDDDYRYQWFNGWTPEAIASGGAPDYLTDVNRNPQPAQPTAPRGSYFSTSAFRRVPSSNYGGRF